MHLCIYKCYLTCTVILSSVSGIFRHIWESLKSILTHIQNFLYPSHIQNPGIFLSQSTFRYIHKTILNNFTKAPSWTFDTVLNVPLSVKDTILHRVFNIIFQTYSGILKIYSAIFVLVKICIKNPSILKNILLQRYWAIF